MPSLSSSQTVLGSKSKGGVLTDSALTSASQNLLKMQSELDYKYKAMVDYYSDFMKYPYGGGTAAAAQKVTSGSTSAGIYPYGPDYGYSGTAMYYQEICTYCNGMYQITQSQYNSTSKRGTSHYCKIQLMEEERAREKKLEHDRYIRGDYGSPLIKKYNPVPDGSDPLITIPSKSKKETQHEKNLRKVFWNYRSRNQLHAA